MESFYANIFVGLKERDTGIVHSISECEEVCQHNLDTVGECVTMKPVKFIYKNGKEDGVEVGFIQYPRFPKDISVIRSRAIELGKLLQLKCSQYRVMINMPNEVVMLNHPELVKD